MTSRSAEWNTAFSFTLLIVNNPEAITSLFLIFWSLFKKKKSTTKTTTVKNNKQPKNNTPLLHHKKKLKKWNKTKTAKTGYCILTLIKKKWYVLLIKLYCMVNSTSVVSGSTSSIPHVTLSFGTDLSYVKNLWMLRYPVSSLDTSIFAGKSVNSTAC